MISENASITFDMLDDYQTCFFTFNFCVSHLFVFSCPVRSSEVRVVYLTNFAGSRQHFTWSTAAVIRRTCIMDACSSEAIDADRRVKGCTDVVVVIIVIIFISSRRRRVASFGCLADRCATDCSAPHKSSTSSSSLRFVLITCSWRKVEVVAPPAHVDGWSAVSPAVTACRRRYDSKSRL